MKAVFCFIKNYSSLTLENLIGYFHAVQTEFFINFFSRRGFNIVKCRQAMHKFYVFIAGFFHHFFVNSITAQKFDSLFPNIVLLSHRNPNVGIKKITIFNAFVYIFGNKKFCTRLRSYFLTFRHQILIRKQRFRTNKS